MSNIPNFKIADMSVKKELVFGSLAYSPSQGDLGALLYWSNLALEASGRDHGGAREQMGPCRASRAEAIIHLAMFESCNAVDRKYVSYLNIEENRFASPQVAMAQAAHDTIVALFPTQAPLYNQLLSDFLDTIPNSSLKTNGITLGALCACEALLLRINDSSNYVEQKIGVDYFPSGLPGEWDVDPISNAPIALGSLWPNVEPFVLTSASQFRPPAFPALTSAQYATEFNEVKSLGQEVSLTRTAEQTEIGIYWAADGRPTIGSPINLFCQLLTKVAVEQNVTFSELARFLALINISMADAGISCWDGKYFYKIWRPITAIRNAHLDGNAGTVADPLWKPLGAPASNSLGVNFTPAFPSALSGHATFGGTIFQIARRLFGTDNIPFSFISPEYNGITTDNQGNIRPVVERSFSSFSQAEMENALSRIYLGVHWRFDSIQGIVYGNQIGNYVFDNILQPL